jgi:hypothetical protein
MRLISILDASDNEHIDAVFRTSGFASYIVLIVCLGIGIGVWVPFVIDYLKGNVGVGWGFGIGWVSFWCLLIAWIAWLRIKAGLMPTNWLVKLNTNTVLIKFRSFQNYAYPETDPVVIEFSWRDIAWVRKTKETSHKDKGDETTTEFFTYLDIRVDLSETELDELIQGLKNERKRKPLRSSLGDLRHELFKARKNKAPKHEIDYIKDKINQEKAMKSQKTSKSSAKYHDYPVRLVHDNILRVRWNSIRPNIKKALAILSKHTKIEEEIKFVTDSTKDLSGKALDDMILERIEQGDEFDAIRLIKKHYGYSTTEAMQFIDELTNKQTEK